MLTVNLQVDAGQLRTVLLLHGDGELKQLVRVEGIALQQLLHHQLAGAVAVIEVKAESLHMAEQIPPNIRFHADTKRMSPVTNHIGQQRFQQKCRRKAR